MKDRLKRKLKAKKMQQANAPLRGHPRRDVSKEYEKLLRAAEALNETSASTRFEDDQSRADDKIAHHISRATAAVEKLFIIVKHQTPHLFAEFEKISTEGLTAEEKQEFYDRIAHLEATQLEDILAGKDDDQPPSQT